MKRSSLITYGLIISVIINLVMFQQIKNYKEEPRLAHFEEVQNGLNYSFQFAETLKDKYSELSLDEKVEYLTAMYWSLTLSAWTLEDIKPNDKEYENLANLFSIYGHIPSEFTDLARKSHTDEEILDLLNTWLIDMKYLKENFNYIQVSEFSDKELLEYLKSLLDGLEYDNNSLEQYRKSLGEAT
ncbi:hypothetical protein IM538_03915 [Cytobacillus suaedae]|nr:hypothetical protein IM538_03915 [Cytobacillus suaedae]